MEYAGQESRIVGKAKRKNLSVQLHREIIFESGRDPPNFRRDNLFNGLLSFLVPYLSKAGGCLEFNV
jgi:hypothetical protein